MGKLVYLFELDSVRKSSEEIKIGQACIFEEIVHNGNTVVISFNQLTDSQAFLTSLENKESFEIMMKFADMGVLKTTPYSGISTASQYIQNAMGEDNCFMFSALPIKFDPKDELANLLRKAIRYGDIQGLETCNNDTIEIEHNLSEKKAFLLRFVRLVHALSMGTISRNPEKNANLIKYHFIDFLDIILSEGSTKCSFAEDVNISFTQTIEMLKTVQKNNPESLKAALNSRSTWYEKLKLQDPESEWTQLGIAIIDLCYNYAVEESIHNVSKHYTELGDDLFWLDFQTRLRKYWEDRSANKHLFSAQDTTDEVPIYRNENLPQWNAITWMYEALQKESEKTKKTLEQSISVTYEQDCEMYYKQWHKKRKLEFIKCFSGISFYMILFFVIEITFDFLGERLEVGISPLFPSWLITCILILIFGFLSDIIQRHKPIPDIFECIRELYKTIKGWVHVRKSNQHVAYTLEETEESHV